MKRFLPLAAKLLLLALSILLGLVLAEQILGWTGYEPQLVSISAFDDERSRLAFETDDFVYHPDLFWRPEKNTAIFNAQGFRGRELPRDKPPNQFRIFAIGDSNTLGWKGRHGANWPGYLDVLFQTSSGRFLVVNAGVWGYSSYQGLIRLKEVLEYRPDMVLISFGSNDAHAVRVPDSEYRAGSVRSRRLEDFLQRFRVGKLLLVLAMQWAALNETDLTSRVDLDQYRANLEEMIRLARERGVQPVLLTRPYIGSIPAIDKWKSFAHFYNTATADVAARHHMPLVDLYTLFKDRERFFIDDSHFTAEGHQRASEIVFQHLQPWLPDELGSRP